MFDGGRHHIWVHVARSMLIKVALRPMSGPFYTAAGAAVGWCADSYKRGSYDVECFFALVYIRGYVIRAAGILQRRKIVDQGHPRVGAVNWVLLQHVPDRVDDSAWAGDSDDPVPHLPWILANAIAA